VNILTTYFSSIKVHLYL